MPVIAGLGYVAAYPLLDWLSYVEPFEGLDITPWNPQVGLSFPLVLLFGRRTIPFLFIAPFISHLLLNLSPVDLSEGIAHAPLSEAVIRPPRCFCCGQPRVSTRLCRRRAT